VENSKKKHLFAVDNLILCVQSVGKLVLNCVQKWLFASSLATWHLEKRICFDFSHSIIVYLVFCSLMRRIKLSRNNIMLVFQQLRRFFPQAGAPRISRFHSFFHICEIVEGTALKLPYRMVYPTFHIISGKVDTGLYRLFFISFLALVPQK